MDKYNTLLGTAIMCKRAHLTKMQSEANIWNAQNDIVYICATMSDLEI